MDHEKMWAFLRDLLARMCGALDGDQVMADGLDAIVELLGADRGLVFLVGADGARQALVGRLARRPMDPLEREEIGTTFVREALETGKFVRYDALAAMSPSASVRSLGIVGALAAPITLPSSARVRGVLYVDFRDRQRVLDGLAVELFLAASTVFGVLLEQHGRAERARDELHEAKSHWVESRPPTSLDELLAYPSLAGLRGEIEAALRSTAPILVLGESGSGKTMLAHAVAEAAGRRPIVRVMLGASDDLNTITSELFGHERGAYSGAVGKRVGLVEYASGGTLVLDELLNLPPTAQRLLLDFTQFGTYRPLGYEKRDPKTADVRLIAATNGDVGAAIRDGRLREDLYHRLAHYVIEMPPLRRRRADIPALAERVLARADPRRRWTLSLDLRRALVSPALEWSGNVRQLERVVLRARDRAIGRDPDAEALALEDLDVREAGIAAGDGARARADDAGDPIASRWQRLQSERARIDDHEGRVLREALDAAGGVIARAARELGIARTTLSSRIDALGIRARKE